MKRQRSPLRKYLFYGLTLVLTSALVLLVIQGRRLEKEQMRQGDGNIQKFTSTPIRVLSPQDLNILNSSMTLEPANISGELSVARHNIEIYNAGTVSYCEIQLRLDYLDANGEVIASIPYGIKYSIPPGDTFVSKDVLMPKIPDATVECRPSIVYGDFETVESERAQ
ncbi:MAG: hypothetical protein P8Y80_11350 [Acidobacteriota bacterium]|jgi:hypothetical protein